MHRLLSQRIYPDAVCSPSMPNSANAAHVRVHILHDPLWVVSQFGNKETGLIYSINGPGQVHVSDDVKFSLRYSDDDHIARELCERLRIDASA